MFTTEIKCSIFFFFFTMMTFIWQYSGFKVVNHLPDPELTDVNCSLDDSKGADAAVRNYLKVQRKGLRAIDCILSP